MPTACALIIGDEILTGKIRDDNTHHLSKLCFENGIELCRVEVLPDDVELIAERVRFWSGKVDHLFTSGGIGPTHDDKTYEAVAKAFDVELALHEPSVERMRAFCEAKGQALNAARLRMATLPIGAEVDELDNAWTPSVRMKNVFILPGVPSFFANISSALVPTLGGEPAGRILLYTDASEGDIADMLRDLDEEFTQVAIGSYPKVSGPYRVMVSADSRDREALDAIAGRLMSSSLGFRQTEEA